MNHESMQTQVVVIGGGGAGLTAAVAAAERGAKVIVLEKRHAVGGNSAMAEGFLAAESPAQKRMNIDARKDAVFRIAMDYSHWRLNARIVRAFINKSGDTVKWLEDKGMYFDWIPSYFPGQRIRTWHCLKKRGMEIIEVLIRECERLGVEILRETGAKNLLRDSQKGLSGVVADHKEREIRIKAGCLIIATGGYGGNEELLKKYNPYYNDNVVLRGIPNKGDGLLMAMEIGAATEGLGLLHFSGHTPHGAADDLLVASDEPNTIWINSRGERFTDEATSFNRFESVNAVLRQPGRFCYTLFDQRIKQNIIDKGIIKGVGCVVLPGTKLPGLNQSLEAAVRKGNARMSESLDDISGWMGIEPAVLRKTVNEYNSYCDRGHDEDFAKDRYYLEALRTPPYCALRCYPRFLGTIGGIKINHHMEVLDHEDNPIPGLYAAGVDTGGWEHDTYNAVLSGTTFGFALNSGRIAGENAAEHIKLL